MATVEAMSARDAGEEFEYRPLSVMAVASLVFGLLSTMIFFAARVSIESALMIAPLPLIGLALGFWARSTMRANPDQYAGEKFAWAGIALSAICLVGGMGFSGFVYATEVPDGYLRTSFAELRPNEVDLRGDHVIPPSIQALEGKKVFIKGYIRPDSVTQRIGVKEFLLVRDDNQCCFGDQSTVKYYDRIDVDMMGSLSVDYKERALYRMGGILKVEPQNVNRGPLAPVFSLKADYAR